MQKKILLHNFKTLIQHFLLTFIFLDDVTHYLYILFARFNLKQSLHRQGAWFLRKNKLLRGIVAFNKGFQRTIRINCTLYLPSEFFSNDSWNKFNWNEIFCSFQAPWKQKTRDIWINKLDILSEIEGFKFRAA